MRGEHEYLPRTKPRLLIVDPSDWGRTAAAALAARGCTPLRAETLESALPAMDRNDVRWVITELRLRGEMSGFDLLRALRGRPRGPRVVVVTAYGSVPGAIAALRHGAADVMVKPVPIGQVISALGLEFEDGLDAERAPWMSLKLARGVYIVDILSEYRTISATAKALGLERKSLRRMLRREAANSAGPVAGDAR
jgi:ActR/RegA family two-component response regulator